MGALEGATASVSDFGAVLSSPLDGYSLQPLVEGDFCILFTTNECIAAEYNIYCII